MYVLTINDTFFKRANTMKNIIISIICDLNNKYLLKDFTQAKEKL